METATSLWHTVAIVGVGCTIYTDQLIASTATRVFILTTLLTFPAVFVLLYILGRRLASNPGMSLVASAVAGVVTLAVTQLNMLPRMFLIVSDENIGRTAVVAAVFCLLTAIVAACYIDGHLDRGHQSLIVRTGGIAMCVIAATMDQTSGNVLLTEIILFAAHGFWVATGFLQYLVPQPKEQSQSHPAKAENGRESFRKMDESRESEPGRSSRRSENEMTNNEHFHPLVKKGFIVNPETFHNIKINGQKYYDLRASGYRPDFVRGTLTRELHDY